tara:strand:+ start:572 stop:1024 length:453 start_codon:yes stop_codon:yes gene_type:complete
MEISKYLKKENIIFDLKSKSKKNLLENIAKMISLDQPIDSDIIFEKLYEREKLGTTGLGKGIAIPHARIPNIMKPKIVVIKLEEPLSFESIDGNDVDIVFALVVPEDENNLHVDLLSKIAELLEDKNFLLEIRNSDSRDEIEKLIKKFDS